ncbi:MAG: Gfo/Idh/MocA family oxidoreductase [Candidatus Poribacteria bacterium]|nr:Gfo/Idh/MocA family oxidoreductase [Candidatus Poribacteria bacterium]
MRNIKIGIIGSGGMARHHAERFASMETAEVVAIASRNEQTGSELAAKHAATFISDWKRLIERNDIDGVVICTHNNSHGEITIAALQANKHVFVEYPLANDVNEGEEALHLAKTRHCVLRVSHPEVISNTHAALKQKIGELGELLLTSFVRLTPGRGSRPEILFNLPVSGTPAHFFIYHIYPIVDLFGEAAWAEGAACYEGLTETGQYNRFVNTVTVGFKSGGIGQWTWAGGIAINTAEQHGRYVLTEGTLSDDGNGWQYSTPNGVTELTIPKTSQPTLQELWLSEIQNTTQHAPYSADAEVALSAIRISLASAQSIHENRRIEL